MRERERSLNTLTEPELKGKQKDIILCLRSARDPEAKKRYEDQLEYVGAMLVNTLTVRDETEEMFI